MENEFTPYPLALRLKALGFKERVLTYFEDDKIKLHDHISGWDFNSSFLNCISRPTYSQAFRWFREKHQLWFRPDYYDELKEYDFQGSIHKLGKYNAIADIGNHETPEEAELACLEKLIEIVEQKEYGTEKA